MSRRSAKVLPSFERHIGLSSTGGHLYVETKYENTQAIVEKINKQYQIDNLQIISAKSGLAGMVGLEFEVFGVHRNELTQICQNLTKEIGASLAIVVV